MTLHVQLKHLPGKPISAAPQNGNTPDEKNNIF